jgi:hypothetical protein
VSDYYASYQNNAAKAMSSLRDDLQTALSDEIVNIRTEWGRRAFDVELERILPFFLHRATGYEEPLGEMAFYKAREATIDAMQEGDVFFRRIQIYDGGMERRKLRAPFFFIDRKDAGYWVIQNLLLLLFLPIFLLSWLLHAPTYFTIRGALKKFVSDKQFHSSIKLVGSIVLLPIVAILAIALLSGWTGRPLFSLVFVLTFLPVSIFVIRELRLPYRYTLTKWRMLLLRWRKKDLVAYLRNIESDILREYKKSAR